MLYYSFTLSQVAIFLGLLYVLTHGFALWRFETARRYLLSFHRNKREGYLLFTAAIAWVVWILLSTDLMEYTNIRHILIIVTLVIGGLVARYLSDYLSVRALSILLMLSAKVLLDSAFLRDEPIKFVITITAYVYASAGIVLIAYPYWFRDILKWIYSRENISKFAWGTGCAFGAILLGLGIFFY